MRIFQLFTLCLLLGCSSTKEIQPLLTWPVDGVPEEVRGRPIEGSILNVPDFAEAGRAFWYFRPSKFPSLQEAAEFSANPIKKEVHDGSDPEPKDESQGP